MYIEGIEAITFHSGPLSDVIGRLKYQGKTGWATIFARLLVGHLTSKWNAGDIGRIIANPASNPERDHTARVLAAAVWHDPLKTWPFDPQHDPTIRKTGATQSSAGKDLSGKRAVAEQHGNFLQLVYPGRVLGKRIVVFDDVCTTGLQLNQVVRRLREWGATSVHGIVLGREPWSS